MAWTFEATRAGYAKLWRAAEIKDGADAQNAERFAEKIIANEVRYKAVQTATGVPWFFIAALHMRESSCSFDGVLHNGEKIIGTGRVTTLHPPGVGPFTTWEESAIHALKSKDLHRVQDWSIERMLHSAEVYNGLGYAGKINSPYVWAGTTQEQTGKYVRDHAFDPNAEDTQLGIAAVLRRLAEKRVDIAAVLQPDQSDASRPQPLPEILPPLTKIGTGGMEPLLNMLLPILLQALAARTQQPGGAQPGQQPDIMSLLLQLTGGQPSPVPPPVIVQPKPEPVVVAPTTPAPKTSVGVGLIGLLGSVLGMVGGQIGTPFGLGEAPTTAGTLSVVIPAAISAIGATGIFGPFGAIAARIAGAAFSAARGAKP